MSENLNDVLAGRAFKQVQPQSDQGDSEKLNLQVGDVFIGTLSKVTEFESKFNKGKMVKGYEFTKLDGSKAFMHGKGNLPWNMSPVKEGQLVKIERLPDDTLENGLVSSSWVVSVAE